MSVALAVTVYIPSATLAQATVYGEAVAVPIKVEPLKNSTLLTVPSLSVADAVKFMVDDVGKRVFVTGELILTVGNVLTFTVTGAEVAVAPKESSTVAVKL